MFWVGDIWSIWGTLDGIQAIFSGEIIPLTISVFFYKLNLFLPFKHLVFTPVFIFLGKYTFVESLIEISLQLVWIFIFTLISFFVLKKGLAKMDSQGG